MCYNTEDENDVTLCHTTLLECMSGSLFLSLKQFFQVQLKKWCFLFEINWWEERAFRLLVEGVGVGVRVQSEKIP